MHECKRHSSYLISLSSVSSLAKDITGLKFLQSLFLCSSFFFFWLNCMICRILVLWQGIRARPPAVEVRRPNTGLLGKSLPSFNFQFSSVQSLSRVWLFATPWIAARQASLSITNSQSSLKLMSIESVMPSSHLFLCRLLLLLPPIPPSVRVFSNESTLCMRWPKYWSFSFSIIPSKEIPGLISFAMDWLDLLAVQGTLKSLQHRSSKASIHRPLLAK